MSPTRTAGRPMTVGQVASLAGITVRTLHHYDETGLLRPSGRSEAGYRLYTDADVTRLQAVLFYRELGFPLDEIATLLDDPAADAVTHLRRQHDLLTRRIRHLQDMAASIELHLEARQMDIDLTPDEMLDIFGEDHTGMHAEYAAEAEQRWGDTDAWAQSRRRTSRYTADDWKTALAEQHAAAERLAAALQEGLPADSEAAMDAAEAHRQQITRWFYDCSYEIHRSLGDMYVQDPRFTATYDDIAPGLAAYVRDAIHANAARSSA